MLNVLKDIHDVLASHGAFKHELLSWHPALQELGGIEAKIRRPVYRVIIRAGKPCAALCMPYAQAKVLRKYGPPSGIAASWTLPVFNLSLKNREKLLNSPEFRKKVKGHFNDLSEELLQKINGASAFALLLREITHSDPEVFIDGLLKFSYGDAKDVQILLDRKKTLYGYRFFRDMNSTLIKYDETHSKVVGTDVYGQPYKEYYTEPFPLVRSGRAIGDVLPWALDDATPCKHPYGIGGSKVWPVNNLLRMELAATLRFLIAKDAKAVNGTNRTCTDVFFSDGRFGAFVVFIPKDINLEYLTEDVSPEEFLTNYRMITEKALSGEKVDGTNVELILLEKKSSSNTVSVSYHEQIGIDEYIQALKRHHDAIAFVRETIDPSFKKRLSSTQLIADMHTDFSAFFTQRTEMVRYDVRRLFRLYYSANADVYVGTVLRDFLGISSAVINQMGYMRAPINERPDDNGHSEAGQIFYKAKRMALVLAYLILRTKTKEQIMQSACYLIGRELSLLDQLHKIYMKANGNNGHTTPIGSQGFSAITSSRSVSLGLSRISGRIVFLKNAKTSNEPDARKKNVLLKKISDISSLIEQQGFPQGRCTDTEIALLTEGFLNSSWDITNTKEGAPNGQENGEGTGTVEVVEA